MELSEYKTLKEQVGRLQDLSHLHSPLATLIYPLKVYLDDYRAAPAGWVRVRTVEEAKELLQGDVLVEQLSLDFDLGPCEQCSWRVPAWMDCVHSQKGMALVEWMVETGFWSMHEPQVHSSNQEGAAQMNAKIAREFPRRPERTVFKPEGL